MEAGWGMEVVRRFHEIDDGRRPIATVTTRDNKEVLCRQGEIEVLPSFPTAWILNGTEVVPESEIKKFEVSAGELST